MDEAAIRSKMDKVNELLVSDISSIRTGRATPALIEDLEVSVYGGVQKLKVQELSTITSPDPQTIVIDPWDKSIVGEIKKGILGANLGYNPSIDGQIIRISLPPLTSEDRQKYVKLLSAKLENARVMVRQIRGDAMRDIKEGFEDKKISEDEKFQQEKKLQEITDEFVGKIDKMGEDKEKELLQI